jgi:universal stress protein A
MKGTIVLQIETILHPTDFSEASEQSRDFAYALARDHGAKLILVTVVVPPSPAEAYLPELPHVAEPTTSLLQQQTQRHLTSMASSIVDVPVETEVFVGSPGPRIVEAAQQWKADLIVMGTLGRTGVSRLLLGSVAEYVLRHATCPVLTIKAGTSGHLRENEPEMAAKVSQRT